MTQRPAGWAEKRWDKHGGKHRANRNLTLAMICESTSKKGPAKYLPSVDDNRHKELELRCITEGRLVKESGGLRCYCLDVQEVIGVCCGEETSLVFVEWGRSGHFHGRPISPGALAKKVKEGDL